MYSSLNFIVDIFTVVSSYIYNYCPWITKNDNPISFHEMKCVRSHWLYPYSRQATNPPNHQESINVRIRLESWRIVNFSTYSVIFYDSDTKQVRNSYEYPRDSAGFGLSRHDTVPSSLRCAITYLEILK